MCFGEEVRVIVLEHRLAGAWKPKKTGPEVQGGSHRGRERVGWDSSGRERRHSRHAVQESRGTWVSRGRGKRSLLQCCSGTKQVTFLLRPWVSEGGGGEGRRKRKAVKQGRRGIQIEWIQRSLWLLEKILNSGLTTASPISELCWSLIIVTRSCVNFSSYVWGTCDFSSDIPRLLSFTVLHFLKCRWLCFPNLIDADRYIVPCISRLPEAASVKWFSFC